MRVVLDGKSIDTERDVHLAFASQLEFGDYYGWNLAALRDRLLTDVPRPVRVVWTDAAESRRRLGAELFDRICEIFNEVVEQDHEFGWTDRFEYELD